MRARELKRWLAESARLTAGQREQVLARLQEGMSQDAVTGLLDRRPIPAACPKCRGERIVRNGRASGLQRFKCRGCGTGFNVLTGALPRPTCRTIWAGSGHWTGTPETAWVPWHCSPWRSRPEPVLSGCEQSQPLRGRCALRHTGRPLVSGAP
jgi:hypothetical protein